MLLGHRDHLVDQGTTEQHGKDGTEIDRQVIPAILGGFTHRTIEGPGGTIYAQSQAVDPGILKGFTPLSSRPVTPPGDHEQHQHIPQCQAAQLPQ